MPLALSYNKVIYDDNNEIKDFIILKTNKSFEEVTGFKKDEVINKKASNILKDIINKPIEFIQMCGEVASNGKSKTLEVYSQITGNYYEASLFNEKEGCFIAIFSDITDRKNREEKLKEKTERLNSIYNNLDDIIWTASWPDLQIEFVSKTVKNIFGYTTEEFKANSSLLREITHPDDKHIHDEALSNLKEKGFSERIFRIITKESSIKWIYDKGKMIYNENNIPVRIEGIMRDITRREQIKKELAVREKHFQRMLSVIPDMVSIHNPDMNIVYSNWSGFAQVPDEKRKLNTKCYRTYRNRDDICPDCQAKKVLKTGNPLQKEVKLPEEGWYDVRVLPIKDEEGEVEYFVEWIRDITKLKQKEKAIKNLHAIAVDFKKAKDKQKVCEMTIEAAENLLDFNFSDISLVEDKLLIPRATTSNAQSKKMAITEGIAGKTYRRGESFVTDNIANNPEAKPVKNSYKSVISIPVGDYGVFQAVRVGKETFTKTDIELAELLISHTTVALERIGYEEELKYKSFHDELTGLYNRRFLSEEVKRLNTERQLPISIIMLDINDLKIINDSLGYNKGDELIVKTAKILKDSVRKEDILARYGGDEFVILLTQTRREKAVEIMERIKRRCEKTNEEELSVSLGAGIATKNNVEQDIDNIFKKANNALNQNKLLDNRSRKNRLVLNLLNTLSTKSDETRNHAARMADLAYKLGIKLGIPHSELDRLSLLASLHDIGKISISEEILIKPGELTEEEWEIIREHPERGYKIASASEEFAVIAQEILSHHERWDGEGYPQGLQGENIPYLSRIISIIDAYDVMTHARPYSKAISKQEALAEIKRCAGSQFDPKLAEIFLEEDIV